MAKVKKLMGVQQILLSPDSSANILRKVASNLSFDLDLLGRRCLTTVTRVRLWMLPKSTLSVESQCL
jgi:putative transposase